jgi:hypothetical protein
VVAQEGGLIEALIKMLAPGGDLVVEEVGSSDQGSGDPGAAPALVALEDVVEGIDDSERAECACAGAGADAMEPEVTPPSRLAPAAGSADETMTIVLGA